MPLVKKDEVTTVKYALESEQKEKLDRYAKFAQASKTNVIIVALQRLFAQDAEWQKHLQSHPLDSPDPTLKPRKKRGRKSAAEKAMLQ